MSNEQKFANNSSHLSPLNVIQTEPSNISSSPQLTQESMPSVEEAPTQQQFKSITVPSLNLHDSLKPSFDDQHTTVRHEFQVEIIPPPIVEEDESYSQRCSVSTTNIPLSYNNNSPTLQPLPDPPVDETKNEFLALPPITPPPVPQIPSQTSFVSVPIGKKSSSFQHHVPSAPIKEVPPTQVVELMPLKPHYSFYKYSQLSMLSVVTAFLVGVGSVALSVRCFLVFFLTHQKAIGIIYFCFVTFQAIYEANTKDIWTSVAVGWVYSILIFVSGCIGCVSASNQKKVTLQSTTI